MKKLSTISLSDSSIDSNLRAQKIYIKCSSVLKISSQGNSTRSDKLKEFIFTLNNQILLWNYKYVHKIFIIKIFKLNLFYFLIMSVGSI